MGLNIERALAKLSESGSTFGLMWEGDDYGNLNLFRINTANLKFTVKYYTDDNWNSIMDWTRCNAINSLNCSNKLRVSREENHVAFYINGVKVFIGPDMTFYGKETGFGVGPEAIVAADNLLIKQNQYSKTTARRPKRRIENIAYPKEFRRGFNL